MSTKQLLTQRLHLRPLQQSDASFLFTLRTNSDVCRFVKRKRFQNITDSEQFIENVHVNKFEKPIQFWLIEALNTRLPMGTICLWNLHHDLSKGELGYEMLPAFHGNGFMLEAAKAVVEFGMNGLNLNRIEAHTHHGNTSSISLLKKLSFIKQDDFEDEGFEENVLFVLRKALH